MNIIYKGGTEPIRQGMLAWVYSPALWGEDTGVDEDIALLLDGIEESFDALEPFSSYN